MIIEDASLVCSFRGTVRYRSVKNGDVVTEGDGNNGMVGEKVFSGVCFMPEIVSAPAGSRITRLGGLDLGGGGGDYWERNIDGHVRTTV